MGRKNDYTTGNLLDYGYFSKHYKLIAIYLSKQIELENSDLKQQINFIGRITKNEGATMFSIIEKLEEATFEFLLNAATIVWFFFVFCLDPIMYNGNTKNCEFTGWYW